MKYHLSHIFFHIKNDDDFLLKLSQTDDHGLSHTHTQSVYKRNNIVYNENIYMGDYMIAVGKKLDNASSYVFFFGGRLSISTRAKTTTTTESPSLKKLNYLSFISVCSLYCKLGCLILVCI